MFNWIKIVKLNQKHVKSKSFTICLWYKFKWLLLPYGHILYNLVFCSNSTGNTVLIHALNLIFCGWKNSLIHLVFSLVVFIISYLARRTKNLDNYSVRRYNYCISILSLCIFFVFAFLYLFAKCAQYCKKVNFRENAVVFTVACIFFKCKDELVNAENDIEMHADVMNANTLGQKFRLHLWVNRSIGAIHCFVVIVFFFRLGWLKCGSCMA